MNIKSKKDVLIVDDSPFVREMVARIVEQLGHVATKARDGEDGLRIAAAREPDVILLDVKMPGLDGVTVLEKLRADERFAKTPIIMLTGVRDEAVVRRSIQSGATAYIVKDEPKELMKRLKEFLD